MMARVPHVVELTQALIAMPSPSQQSNAAISAYLATLLEDCGFRIEELSYLNGDQRNLRGFRSRGRVYRGFRDRALPFTKQTVLNGLVNVVPVAARLA